jgi:type I restriction enzyme, S subunit
MLKGGRRAPISELCTFQNGNGFRPHQWKLSGLPIIRIQNLNGSSSFNFFDGEAKNEWLVEPGDLLFAWAGVKGVSFGPTIWPGPKGVLNQHIFKVLPNKGIDSYWLYAVLKFVTSRIETQAHGFKSSLVHVHKEDITGQVIDVPQLSDQRRIAAVLQTWDLAINRLELLLNKLNFRREALRANLIAESEYEADEVALSSFLAESRLPGTNGAKARKISVKLYGKGAVEKSENRSGSVSTRYFRRVAGQLIYSKLDFLNGAFAIVPESLDGFESTLDLPAFDISSEVNPLWLIEYLTRPNYYANQLHLARGQRKARRVPPEGLLASSIRLPDRKLQDRIVDILSTADEEIRFQSKRLKALSQQRRGLAQKLLTGEWRTKV